MSETRTVGLTKEQRDILLQGLRFMRSSVLMELRDPGPEADEDRRTRLQKIETLVDQLDGPRG